MLTIHFLSTEQKYCDSERNLPSVGADVGTPGPSPLQYLSPVFVSVYDPPTLAQSFSQVLIDDPGTAHGLPSVAFGEATVLDDVGAC